MRPFRRSVGLCVYTPMKAVTLGLMMPLGRRWKLYSTASTTTVCPALLPPCRDQSGTRMSVRSRKKHNRRPRQLTHPLDFLCDLVCLRGWGSKLRFRRVIPVKTLSMWEGILPLTWKCYDRGLLTASCHCPDRSLDVDTCGPAQTRFAVRSPQTLQSGPTDDPAKHLANNKQQR